MLKRSAMVYQLVSNAFSSVLIDEIDISQSIAFNMEAYRHRQKFNQTPVNNIDPFHVILLLLLLLLLVLLLLFCVFVCVERSILFPEQMSFITLYLAFQMPMLCGEKKVGDKNRSIIFLSVFRIFFSVLVGILGMQPWPISFILSIQFIV